MLAQCTHTHVSICVQSWDYFPFLACFVLPAKKNSGIVPNSPPAPQLIDFPKPWQQAMIPKNRRRRRRRHTFSQSAVFHQKPSILPQTTKTHPFFARTSSLSLPLSLIFTRSRVKLAPARRTFRSLSPDCDGEQFFRRRPVRACFDGWKSHQYTEMREGWGCLNGSQLASASQPVAYCHLFARCECAAGGGTPPYQ